MMDFSNKLVISLAGKDKGRVFVVLKNVGENFVLYADGRRRRIEKPKLKKKKHIKVIGDAGIEDISAVTNGMLRKATAANMVLDQGYSCSGQPANKEG